MSDNNIIVAGSPHVATKRTISRTMWLVALALMPALACSVMFFGIDALIVVAATMAGCLLTEFICCRYMLGQGFTLGDGSAALTGLLLGMSLPSSLPLGMAFVGGVFAIAVGKMAYGGLGRNIFNPAMVGRVFLLISFPVAMTTWPVPMMPDGTTGATVLTAIRESGFDGESIDIFQMALGNMGGSLGEVGAFALLLGGIFLIAMRVIKIYIPLAILGSIALLCLLTGQNPIIELLSGGLLLGAIFMATDYVTSPMTRSGKIVYGLMIGTITFVIRHYGSYPEGISFAILLMNGCTPLINRWMRPRVFGERRRA